MWMWIFKSPSCKNWYMVFGRDSGFQCQDGTTLIRKLEIAGNKFSFKKKMFRDLFSEETSYGSILVNDHLL